MIENCLIVTSEEARKRELDLGFFTNGSKFIELLQAKSFEVSEVSKCPKQDFDFDILIVEDELQDIKRILVSINSVSEISNALICTDAESLRFAVNKYIMKGLKLITLDFDLSDSGSLINSVHENYQMLRAFFSEVPMICLSNYTNTEGFEELVSDIRLQKTNVFEKLVLGPALGSIIRNTIALNAAKRNNEKQSSEISKLEVENFKLAIENERLSGTPSKYTYKKEDFKSLIGSSDGMDDIKFDIHRLSKRDRTVFIRGETGTGKEVIARLLHELSGRGAFIPVNCGALSPNIAASLLFGTLEGSFSDAKDTLGYFGSAEGGTIFLDEIDSLPLDQQVNLLRAIDQKEITPVGKSFPKKIDVRIIVASNANNEKLNDASKFRADLFFRIKSEIILIPPLRDRKQDIPELCAYFLDEEVKNDRFPNSKFSISKAGLKFLEDYHWPGNIRELKDILVSATLSKIDHFNTKSGEKVQIGLELLKKTLAKRNDDVSFSMSFESKNSSSAQIGNTLFPNPELKNRTQKFLEDIELALIALIKSDKKPTITNVSTQMSVTHAAISGRITRNAKLMAIMLNKDSSKFPNLISLISNSPTKITWANKITLLD